MELILSFLAAVITTFVFLKLGFRFGLVDKPAGKLKPHERPVPFTGGTGVIVAMIPWLISDWRILAIAVLWFVGLLDDIRGISPLIRLVAELLTGFIGAYFVFGNSFALSLVLAVFFAGVVNAYNMIDGMDGICGGVTVVTGIFLSFIRGYESTGRLLAGAYGGFLVFNYPPAKIFLGDEGSYVVGSIMGLALLGTFGSPDFLRVLAISWLPLNDLAAGFIRRILAGKSPLSGDRDHFYDKLFSITGRNKKVTFYLAVLMTFVYGIIGNLDAVTWLIIVALAFFSILQLIVLKSFSTST